MRADSKQLKIAYEDGYEVGEVPEVAGQRDSRLRELQDYAQSVSVRALVTAKGEEKTSEPASETLSVPYSEKRVFKIARHRKGANT